MFSLPFLQTKLTLPFLVVSIVLIAAKQDISVSSTISVVSPLLGRHRERQYPFAERTFVLRRPGERLVLAQTDDSFLFV
jgi:hypothetical protein